MYYYIELSLLSLNFNMPNISKSKLLNLKIILAHLNEVPAVPRKHDA